MSDANETTNATEQWAVRLVTGVIRLEGQGFYARRAAVAEVTRIARNAAAEVGRSGPGIGWATAAHPAEVVSRVVTTTTRATEWRLVTAPDATGGDER